MRRRVTPALAVLVFSLSALPAFAGLVALPAPLAVVLVGTWQYQMHYLVEIGNPDVDGFEPGYTSQVVFGSDGTGREGPHDVSGDEWEEQSIFFEWSVDEDGLVTMVPEYGDSVAMVMLRVTDDEIFALAAPAEDPEEVAFVRYLRVD